MTMQAGKKPVARRVIVALILLAGPLIAGLSEASSAIIATQHLIVSDANNKLSDARLKSLADLAQATFERILEFWSVDSGIDRFGKIRVIFDVPRRDIYGSVFLWKREDGLRRRVVRVFGSEGSPHMLAHKLTSALLPQKDKLIRNMMGILTEVQVGNPLSFPGCGFSSDDWVLAFIKAHSFIPLNELGPDHESWGMKDAGDGNLSVFDRAKQFKAYAEAGSFGNYLILTYGINKIKKFHKFSARKERPWQDVFGKTMQELEANWLKALHAEEKTRDENVSTLSKLFKGNPNTACGEAQNLVTLKQ